MAHFRLTLFVLRLPARLLVVAMLLPGIAPAQSTRPIPSDPSQDRSLPGEGSGKDPARVKLERDMAKHANQEREAALKRDSDKLFQLATELKAYVDKTNEHVLSMDVIKKAEEIERLAHSVKEKMKG